MFYFLIFCIIGVKISFSPKCYVINEGANIKRSHKGVPKSACIETSSYIGALFDDRVPKGTFSRISRDKRVGGTATVTVEKKMLNPVYLKLRVANDLVSVEPLQTESGFV